ncbi:MAG TPA: LacI family DNA-binding transcriptional regulator [Bryobacteraceae bacterium]|jgi:DNA-binding LacI/PurR family transcriptional regulator
MAVSIKDIARLAGVSHSTVSRALRNSPLIPPPTAQRIQQIAAETGYSASAVARSLVNRKTEAIGVVVTSIADPFNGEVVAGIEEIANREGYSVILATSQADPEREMTVVRSFRERRVDGILVASSRLGANYLPLLSELEAPIVLLNNQHPSKFAHSVTIDNVDGGRQATRHLIQLGHRRIAYLGDQSGLQSDAERFKGFQATMVEAGLRVVKEYVVRGDGKPDGGRKKGAELLLLKNRPSAIFCYNDMTALGVMEQAAKMRLSVPRDLSMVGFDDLFFAALLQPPLTTIRQPKKELGQRAMQLLIALLKGEQAERTIMIRGELASRGSSTKPRRYQSI